jgi:hypothetical protein
MSTLSDVPRELRTDEVDHAVSDDLAMATAETTPKSLVALAAYIRRDATRDASRYLLRSNTSHDGE